MRVGVKTPTPKVRHRNSDTDSGTESGTDSGTESGTDSGTESGTDSGTGRPASECCQLIAKQ